MPDKSFDPTITKIWNPVETADVIKECLQCGGKVATPSLGVLICDRANQKPQGWVHATGDCREKWLSAHPAHMV